MPFDIAKKNKRAPKSVSFLPVSESNNFEGLRAPDTTPATQSLLPSIFKERPAREPIVLSNPPVIYPQLKSTGPTVSDVMHGRQQRLSGSVTSPYGTTNTLFSPVRLTTHCFFAAGAHQRTPRDRVVTFGTSQSLRK